ncbi:hypothetical protein ABZV60_12145 [Streptomyces sp. NPDC004787]|uniref:hypothetical protein n=1 Tax=Streptomyces sp. NPDC004787 TaxID=3154291 RepID=UPI0033B82243
MNAIHQHALDTHRAARHAAPAPPFPGTLDAGVWRAVLRRLRDLALGPDLRP